MVAFFIYFTLSTLVAWLAGKRGRNIIGWLFGALLISPLISGFLLFVLPDLEEERRRRSLDEALNWRDGNF